MTEPTAPRQIGGALTVTAIVLSLATWRIAFNLGAFGAILYDDVFAVLVTSMVLFVVTVLTRPFRPQLNRAAGLVLAAPSAWFTSAVIVEGSTDQALERPVFVVALVLVMSVSIPVTLRLVVLAFHPELSASSGRSLTVTVLIVAAVVGSIGFLVGRNNDRVMTCSDFEVAGSFQPENCVRDR